MNHHHPKHFVHLPGSGVGSSAFQRYDASRSASDSGEKDTDSGDKKEKEKPVKSEKKDTSMKKPATSKGSSSKGKQKKNKNEDDEDNEEHDETNPFLEKHRKGDDEDDDDEGPPSDGGMEVKSRPKKSKSGKKPAAKSKKNSGEKKKKSKKTRKNDGGDGSSSSETEDDIATATARMEVALAMEKAQEAEAAAHPNIEILASQQSEFEARSELFIFFMLLHVEVGTHICSLQDLDAQLDAFASQPLESNVVPQDLQSLFWIKIKPKSSQWLCIWNQNIWCLTLWLFCDSMWFHSVRPRLVLWFHSVRGWTIGWDYCWDFFKGSSILHWSDSIWFFESFIFWHVDCLTETQAEEPNHHNDKATLLYVWMF